MSDKEEWKSAVAYLKAFLTRYEENKSRTLGAMQEHEKWVNEQLWDLGKLIADTEGTENSKGEKEATVNDLRIKLNKDGTLKYINYGGDYVISSFGTDGAFIDKVEALYVIYNRLSKSIEMTHRVESLIKELPNVVEQYKEQVQPNAQKELKSLDKLTQQLGKFLVNTFGYSKFNNSYYITDISDNGKKKTLEIKVEKNGSVKYIRLGNKYVVSQYGFSQRDDYVHLIELLQQHTSKKIEQFEAQRKDALPNLPEGMGEEVKQYRELLTERVKELATKLAIWYGMGDANNNYNFRGEINYNGKDEPIKIKIEKGDLKYISIGDRYIYSTWGDGPYMSWLINTHRALYRELMHRIEGVKVQIEEAGANKRIPVEATKHIEHDSKELEDFEIEEGRILLDEERKMGDTLTRKVIAWKDGRMEIWDNYSMKEVKTRTSHGCEACGRNIEKGEKALVITEQTKHGKRFSHYYCSDEYAIKEQEIKISKGVIEKEPKQPSIGL